MRDGRWKRPVRKSVRKPRGKVGVEIHIKAIVDSILVLTARSSRRHVSQSVACRACSIVRNGNGAVNEK